MLLSRPVPSGTHFSPARRGRRTCRLRVERLQDRSLPSVQVLATLGDPAAGPGAAARLKREVNAAVGRWAVRSGATLPLRRVYDDPSNGFDICDVRGKTCF